MRVFVAGATGAVGKMLIPLLVSSGHEVVGMTRSRERVEWLRRNAAEAVVADALEREAVLRAVVTAEPEVVVHELTALSSLGTNLRRLPREFAQTNRLRTEATDFLCEAAGEVGARRIIAQSFAGWTYARTGSLLKRESDPLDPDPPPGMRSALEALRYLERAVLGSDGPEGVVLRYGTLYGPGTSFGGGGIYLEEVRRRRFPVVGTGSAVWSFIHVADAAQATRAAVELGAPGVYNIVDDDPAPVSVWLPELAAAIGAKPPRRVPVWLARLIAGDLAVVAMTQIRGASNAKAKRELDWQPTFASWLDGFCHALFDVQR
jgi:nucleoside-diphosphate-sugar epimerase